jgi:hypothetical protein
VNRYLTEQLVKYWKQCYDRYPRATIATTLVAFVFLGFTIFFVNKADQNRQETARQQNLSYGTQIAEMTRMEQSLHNLTDFVQGQKTKLKESEDLIAYLKSEQERLKPFVDADRKAIQAVFDLQDERNRSTLWRERWIGFGLGVLASLIASFLFATVSYVSWRRRSPKA